MCEMSEIALWTHQNVKMSDWGPIEMSKSLISLSEISDRGSTTAKPKSRRRKTTRLCWVVARHSASAARRMLWAAPSPRARPYCIASRLRPCPPLLHLKLGGGCSGDLWSHTPHTLTPAHDGTRIGGKQPECRFCSPVRRAMHEPHEAWDKSGRYGHGRFRRPRQRLRQLRR